MMPNIDREQLGEWLSAYIDGELNEKQTAAIERLLREDEGARRQWEALRRTISLVSALPRHGAPPSIREDVQLHIERNELLGDTAETPPPMTGTRGSPFVKALSAAAVLALSAAGVWFIVDQEMAGRSTRMAMAPESPDAATLETDESESGSVPERSAAVSAEEVFASASLEQKLRAGAPPAVVREHRFDNEPVRVMVTVQNELQQEAVTQQLASYLSRQRFADLSDAAEATEDAEEPTRAAEGFFYAGQPSVNYADASQRQVLVRARQSDLAEVVGRLASATIEEDRIALAAGPVSIRGASATQMALQGVDPTTVARGAKDERLASSRTDAAAEADATDAPSSAADPRELFANLLERIGIDDHLVPRKPADASTSGNEETRATVATKVGPAPAGPATGDSSVAMRPVTWEPKDKPLTPTARGTHKDVAVPSEPGGKSERRMKTADAEVTPAPAPAPGEFSQERRRLARAERDADTAANAARTTAETAASEKAVAEPVAQPAVANRGAGEAAPGGRSARGSTTAGVPTDTLADEALTPSSPAGLTTDARGSAADRAGEYREFASRGAARHTDRAQPATPTEDGFVTVVVQVMLEPGRAKTSDTPSAKPTKPAAKDPARSPEKTDPKATGQGIR